MSRSIKTEMYEYYCFKFRQENPDAPLEEIVRRAEKEAESAQLVWDLSTLKNVAQIAVLPLTLAGYALKGYAVASGQAVPIPDDLLDIGLGGYPAVNIVLGTLMGRKMSQFDSHNGRPTKIKQEMVKGAGIGAVSAAVVAAMGYGVGYAAGYLAK